MAEHSELLAEALVHLRAINAQLERLLERIPDPHAPLAEAIEWESSDGVWRTTDKAQAENWAAAVGVRVVRRAAAGVTACIPTLPMSEVSGVVFVFHPEDPMLQLLPEGTHVVLQRRVPTPKDGVAIPDGGQQK